MCINVPGALSKLSMNGKDKSGAGSVQQLINAVYSKSYFLHNAPILKLKSTYRK